MRRLVRECMSRPGLAPHAPAIAAYLDKTRSEETAAAVERRFMAFIEWAERIDSHEYPQDVSLPVEPERMLRYAKYLDGAEMAMTTIYNYLATIGSVHKALGHFAPANHPTVKDFLAELRAERAGDEMRKATALSEQEYYDVLGSLGFPRVTRGGNLETEDTARTRSSVESAMLRTMVQAGLRRGEAATLTWGDFAEVIDGSLTGRVRIRTGGSEDEGHVLTVAQDSAATLMFIKPKDAGDDDLIFKLSGAQITRRLKTMCRVAGIDPENVSGNTPRATLARILTDKGAPVEFIHHQLRLQPPYTLRPYFVDHSDLEAIRWIDIEGSAALIPPDSI